MLISNFSSIEKLSPRIHTSHFVLLNFFAGSEPGILTAEAVNHIRARNSGIREGTVFHGTIPEDPLPIPGSKNLESDCSRVEPRQLSGGRSAQNRQRRGESESQRSGVDFPESGGVRRRRKSSVKEETTVMWVVTEDRK